MVSEWCRESVSYVFFFQAEDGIRDLTVTGVQTCALPISMSPELKSTPGPLSASASLSLRFCRRSTSQRTMPPTMIGVEVETGDRKSTRLNSSHSQISYAVFCLKKKKNDTWH